MKKQIISILLLLLAVNVTNSQTYETVTIASSVWMVKNLDVAKFSNGDAILQINTAAAWEKAYKEKKPAWCYYNFDPAMGVKYGKLYNGFAVLDKRGLAPSGWHVATDEEWVQLNNFLVPSENAKKYKSTSSWPEGYNGTNESGFTALPNGAIMYWGKSIGEGQFANFWTSSVIKEGEKTSHYHRQIDFGNGLNHYYSFQSSGNGYAVRCVKN